MRRKYSRCLRQKQIWSILWYKYFFGKVVYFFPNISDNFHLRISNIHMIILDFIQSMIMIMTIMVMTTTIIVMIRKAPPHLLISLERLDQHMWPININIIVHWSIHYIILSNIRVVNFAFWRLKATFLFLWKEHFASFDIMIDAQLEKAGFCNLQREAKF